MVLQRAVSYSELQIFQNSVTQLPLSPSLALLCAHGQGYFVSGEPKLPQGSILGL